MLLDNHFVDWAEVPLDISIENFLKNYPLQLTIYLKESVDRHTLEDIKKQIIEEYQKMDITIDKMIIE